MGYHQAYPADDAADAYRPGGSQRVAQTITMLLLRPVLIPRAWASRSPMESTLIRHRMAIRPAMPAAMGMPAMQALLDLVACDRFKQIVADLGGYDTRETGKFLAEY